MPTTKTCTKCGETKPLDGFPKQRGGKYGVSSTCKPCATEYQRCYREENRDKIAERQRSYYEANRDKIAEYQRRHHEANRDDIRERKRRYYEANRDRIAEKGRRYRAENRDIVNAKTSKHARATQELTEMFATAPKRAPWMPEEVTFLLADNGMTTYEKAVKLGRTYDSCNGKLGKLRKKLGVSPGDH